MLIFEGKSADQFILLRVVYRTPVLAFIACVCYDVTTFCHNIAIFLTNATVRDDGCSYRYDTRYDTFSVD